MKPAADDLVSTAITRMKAKVAELRALNKKAVEGRRFRSGTFDFTVDKERTALIKALEEVIKAFEV